MCYGPQLPLYQFELQHAGDVRRAVRLRRPGSGAGQHVALEHRSAARAGDHPARRLVLVQRQRHPPQGTPCLAYYDGSGGTCPQLFPELGTGGVGPHGAAKYEYDPANPSETKFPPYYDDAVFFGEFTRDYLREIRLDSQGRVFKINNTLNCGALPTHGLLFECDNPMDMQFGDDGNLYLLTYGDGFFVANPDAGMYRFEYVAGEQKPQAVLARRRPTAWRRSRSTSRATARRTRIRTTRSRSSGTSTATGPSTRWIRTRSTRTPPTASTRRG